MDCLIDNSEHKIDFKISEFHGSQANFDPYFCLTGTKSL